MIGANFPPFSSKSVHLSRNLPIGNRVEPSPQENLAEGSDKGLSAQYFRPNLRPICQLIWHHHREGGEHID
jgi:hypothetical protein